METNIVVMKLDETKGRDEFLTELEELQIRAVAFGPQLVRMVTHLDLTDDMLNELENRLKKYSS